MILNQCEMSRDICELVALKLGSINNIKMEKWTLIPNQQDITKIAPNPKPHPRHNTRLRNGENTHALLPETKTKSKQKTKTTQQQSCRRTLICDQCDLR